MLVAFPFLRSWICLDVHRHAMRLVRTTPASSSRLRPVVCGGEADQLEASCSVRHRTVGIEHSNRSAGCLHATVWYGRQLLRSRNVPRRWCKDVQGKKTVYWSDGSGERGRRSPALLYAQTMVFRDLSLSTECINQAPNWTLRNAGNKRFCKSRNQHGYIRHTKDYTNKGAQSEENKLRRRLLGRA